MNHNERHQALKMMRARIIRKRVLMIFGLCVIATLCWHGASRYVPASYAPPPPARIGWNVLGEIASNATSTINSMYTIVLPEKRDEKKKILRVMKFHRDENHQSPIVFRFCSAPILPVSIPIEGDSLSVSAPIVCDTLANAEDKTDLEILLIGLDTRLGKSGGRADALHLLSVNLSIPHITITSIPRGTRCEVGYENPARNIIANVRSTRGRNMLMKKVAELCGKKEIPYYIESGFSQAIGALELLGYSDPMSEFQALRTRRGLRLGDHNRSYNQGEFLKHALRRLFPLLEGLTGEMIISAGLRLVETNLSKDMCLGIIYTLNDAGITKCESAISHRVFGKFSSRFARKSATIIEGHEVPGVRYAASSTTITRAEQIIRSSLAIVAENRGSHRRVKESLWRIFQQRGWLQIPDKTTRLLLRDSLANHLKASLSAMGNLRMCGEIDSVLKADTDLFFQAEK